MKLAYLTNVYPAVSHSFIRREIEGLEAAGVEVVRWSVRPCSDVLPDPADQREAAITGVLLAMPFALAAATMLAALRTPVRFAATLRASLSNRPAGLRSLVVRCAHVAQACLLARLCRRNGVTHVHAHFGTNPAAVARLCRLMGGPPFSFTVHGPDEFDKPEGLSLGAKVEAAAFVVAISNFGRSQLMRWSRPARWDAIHVVRCGLDRRFLDAPVHATSDFAAPVFCCVARLAPQKGLPVLAEAASILVQQGHDFKIVLIGDGPMRSELQTEVVRRGLQGVLEFRGWASASDVRQAVLASRAFILPSFGEGLPVAIMEALALERPVITTRIAGIPELVDDACGWLVHPGDAHDLASAMKAALASSPEALRRLGATGRGRVIEHHDAAANAARLLKLFQAYGP